MHTFALEMDNIHGKAERPTIFSSPVGVRYRIKYLCLLSNIKEVNIDKEFCSFCDLIDAVINCLCIFGYRVPIELIFNPLIARLG